MKAEQQRIAIAEATGWKCSEYSHELGRLVAQLIPDFIHDLNAMQSAENTLSVRDKQGYISILRNICTVAGCWPETATSAQRAEAFLRTIGEWEDDKC
jgi:hypothetical protein